jgi:hypothetical protein
MFGPGAIKARSVVPHSVQPLRSASSGFRATRLACTLAVLVTRDTSFRDLRPLELGLDARSGGLFCAYVSYYITFYLLSILYLLHFIRFNIVS